MKIKTQDLTGPALDWAVAVCNGFDIKNPNDLEYLDHADLVLMEGEVRHYWEVSSYSMNRAYDYRAYSPSTAGDTVIEIMEREKIAAAYEPSLIYDDSCRWKALCSVSDNEHMYGPTVRAAVCRCFVASKLGDEVDIPEELLQ